MKKKTKTTRSVASTSPKPASDAPLPNSRPWPSTKESRKSPSQTTSANTSSFSFTHWISLSFVPLKSSNSQKKLKNSGKSTVKSQDVQQIQSFPIWNILINQEKKVVSETWRSRYYQTSPRRSQEIMAVCQNILATKEWH